MDFDRVIKARLERAAKQRQTPYAGRRECCRYTPNLQYALGLNNKIDKVTLKCRKCGTVHYNVAAKPGRFKIPKLRRVG